MKYAIVIFVLILGIWFLTSSLSEESFIKIRINYQDFSVEVANTQEKRVQGLSGREEIGSDGMLFVFPEEEFHGIWMKDMRFPIDIVWVSENGKIVHIEEKISPESYPEVFQPDERALYVIEFPSGFIHENSLKISQKIDIAI